MSDFYGSFPLLRESAELSVDGGRQVEVRLGMNLKGLHDVIQAVFGWQDYFPSSSRSARSARCPQLRVG
jgi:hypothetical protein